MRQISCKATAKLIRAALRESFPGIKFGVRSDHNAVRISWIDGPTDKQVEAVARVFQGGYFDGMIDFAGSIYHRLDGEIVHFGAKYITTTRAYSDALTDRAWASVCRKYDAAQHGKLGTDRWGCYWLTDGANFQPILNCRDSLSDLLRNARYFRSCYPEPRPSATVARVTPHGDDGYGAGTVGTPERPGGNKGYPHSDPTA